MVISVIIPTFNRLGAVFRAIDSVCHQSYQDLEIIVIDDGSTDQTEKWIRLCKDPRVQYFKTENKGVSAARNLGVSRAKSEWLCFLDSDDVWHRHKLSEQIKYHKQNLEILASQTEDIWIRNSDRVNKMKKHQMAGAYIFEKCLKLCMLTCSSLMIKKSFFLDLGGFDESMFTCEDYDLSLRIAAKYPIGLLEKPLITKFGGHADQLSKKYPVMDKYRIDALEKILNSGILNQEQEQLVKAEIECKIKIINTGSLKRDKGKYETLRE